MTVKNPSQTELYGELLTNEQQYRKDIAPYDYTHEEIDAIVCLVCNGDEQAKEQLLLSLLNYIEYWARRWSRAYGWTSNRIEYQELVSVGNVAIVEGFEKGLSKDDPWRYLAAYAKYAMWQVCRQSLSLIKTPDRKKPLTVESLDAPIGDTDGVFFGDTIADPVPDVWVSSLEISEEALMQAFRRLGPVQQEVIGLSFGLPEYGKERHCTIVQQRECTKQTVTQSLQSGITALRRFLETSSELYSKEEVRSLLDVSDYIISCLVSAGQLTNVFKGWYAKKDVDILLQEKEAHGKIKVNYHAIVPKTIQYDSSEEKEVYTRQEACRLLNVTIQQFQYLRRKHHIPMVAKGNYPKSEIERLVQLQQTSDVEMAS